MANRTMDCDLVVLGAGNAGLIAAVKAADMSGKKVIVLEKAKKPGGASIFAHGGLGLTGSKLQQDAGEPAQDNAAAGGGPAMRRSPGAESQGLLYDWLVEKVGKDKYLQLIEAGAGMPGMGARIDMPMLLDKYKDHPDPSIGPGWMGTYIVTRMLAQCEKMGIPVLTETRAREFITDREGRLTGVIADTEDGVLVVNCKACFVGAGGFGADYEKCRKKWPEYFNNKTMLCLAPPSLTGDCIDMAERIGAAIDTETQWVSIAGPVHHPYSYTIYRIMAQPEVVYVNLNGERWLDESKGLFAGYEPLGLQPKAEMYAIADHDLTEMLGERLIANPPAESDLPILRKFREDIAYEVSIDEKNARGNHTKKGDTLEELALKMNMDPKHFVAAIERYNRHCENGQDPDFEKNPEYLIPIRKPPFYAFWGQRFSQCTHGGIVVNLNAEVLDKNGQIMPGLFAGGDCTTVNGRGEGGFAWSTMGGFLGGISAARYLTRA